MGSKKKYVPICFFLLGYKDIVVCSADTDVFIMSLALYDKIGVLL